MDDWEFFRTSLEEWERDTRHMSYDVTSHPAYRRIIAMKERAIPLILEELQKNSSRILVALHEITGENPCPHEHAGRIKELTNDWLAWGKQKGFLPAG